MRAAILSAAMMIGAGLNSLISLKVLIHVYMRRVCTCVCINIIV